MPSDYSIKTDIDGDKLHIDCDGGGAYYSLGFTQDFFNFSTKAEEYEAAFNPYNADDDGSDGDGWLMKMKMKGDGDADRWQWTNSEAVIG